MARWLPLLLPCAGLAGTPHHALAVRWLVGRLALLWATPWAVLAASHGRLGPWLLGAVLVHLAVGGLNAWHVQRRLAGGGVRVPARWAAVWGLGVLGLALFTATRLVSLQTVQTDDLQASFPRGTRVVVDLWNRRFSDGDVVWHRCLDGQPRCIHRILAMGPERVERLDASMERAVLVPDHWMFILSDVGVAGEDSRTIGPMPPTHVVGRAHRF